MRLEDKNMRALEKYEPDPKTGTNPDDALSEAMNLLYDIMNGSYRVSGTCLEIKTNNTQENIQGLYWNCKELMEKTGQDYEKTGFLSMSVLEHTWEKARPLCLCSLDDMLNGDLSMLEKAKRLEKILSENIYKEIWADRSESYMRLLDKIGFQPDPDVFKDLTKIMDPLLDALTFYTPKSSYPAHIYQIRDGARASAAYEKNPAIARAMCLYQSEKSLVDAVMAVPNPCVMAFGAIEKTHAQVEDHFYEWYNGHPGERQRNMMRNDGLTDEQYQNMICDYTRTVYLCVKSGDACWLVSMPWRGDMYRRIGDKNAEYYYGKRASYAPYQIFFNTAPPAPEGSNLLAVKQTAWLLSDLMDTMSMAWYPAFLDETIRVFFKSESIPASSLILPEEIAAVRPDSGTPDGNSDSPYAIVPVHTGVPARCTWTYTIRQPCDLFQDEPWILELFQYFQISAGNIQDIPILAETAGTPGNMSKVSNGRLRKAYLKLLAEAIAEKMRDPWDIRKYMLDQTYANMDKIIQMAGDGDLMAFMTCTVDGTPVRKPDGSIKMVRRNRPPWDEIPDTIKTDPDDARQYRKNPTTHFGHIVHWLTSPTASRPPVVWKIRPETGEQCALLAGVDFDELPDILKLYGPLQKFYKTYRDILPSDLTNKYIFTDYGRDKMRSCFIPCIMALNICMTKTAYKKFPYFKSESKQKEG